MSQTRTLRISAGNEALLLLVCVLIYWGAYVLPFVQDILISPFNVVSDDGRHFVTWLRKLNDPGLFPNDPIADYFSSLTPQAYRVLYYPAAWLRIDVQVWHLFFVTPLSIAAFLWSANRCLRFLFLNPVHRLLVVVFLAESFVADTQLGLPRSFREAIVFSSFALYLERRPIAFAAVMGVGANLYPSAVMVAGSAIALFWLWQWLEVRRFPSRDLFSLLAGGTAALVGLSFFVVGSSHLGETVTLEQARSTVNFSSIGRTRFFLDSTLETVFSCSRGGLLPSCLLGIGWADFVLAMAAMIAGWIALSHVTSSDAHSFRRIRHLMVSLIIAGLSLYTIAWIVAFRMHLPSRYVEASINIVWGIGLGAALLLGLKTAMSLLRYEDDRFLIAPILILLGMGSFGAEPLRRDNVPAISSFLRSTPPDTLIAGIPLIVDSVPASSARSVYVSPELTVPYKKDYLDLMSGRAEDLFSLHQGPPDDQWRAILRRSQIDYIIVYNRRMGKRTRSRERWTWQGISSFARNYFHAMEAGARSIFETYAAQTSQCIIVSDNVVSLVDMRCFERAMSQNR